MKRPKTLPAFTQEEYILAKRLLATRVATMMGRKFEEDDWAFVYCTAKGIPQTGWSNLNIDVMYRGLGVEHKMLKKPNKPIKEWAGTRMMHPAATRSIRIPSTDDPNAVMRDVLNQYAELIEQRREQVRRDTPDLEPDMRTGWLLWQDSLEEFLYFEEEMIPPKPNDYEAKWMDSGGRGRKESKNLWVYEKETGHKKYSITTSAGAKIQPYFDVPPPIDPNLYLFRVQGEETEDGLILLWVTASTGHELKRVIGDLSVEALSSVILNTASEIQEIADEQISSFELAVSVKITSEAYQTLKELFPGVSDEHLVRLLIQQLQENK